jgi:hypothetical protein
MIACQEGKKSCSISFEDYEERGRNKRKIWGFFGRGVEGFRKIN